MQTKVLIGQIIRKARVKKNLTQLDAARKLGYDSTQCDMNAKKTEMRAYLTPQELKEQVVDWSKDTLKRRIENEGFQRLKTGILI